MPTPSTYPSFGPKEHSHLIIKLILAFTMHITLVNIQIAGANAAPLAIKNQARQNIKLGNSQQALSILDKYSQNAGADSEFFFLKARALQDLRRNTDALANYSIAIYLNPKYLMAIINRGLVKGALKDIDGALLDLNLALTLQPNNPAALLNRGVTYGGLNQPLLAIADFNRIIQLDPNNADAFRNRGLTKHLMGDKSSACIDWARSKDLGIAEASEWIATLCK